MTYQRDLDIPEFDPTSSNPLTKSGFLTALSALTPTGLTKKQAMRILRLRKLPGMPAFVALVGNRVVGTASLIVEPKFIHNGGIVGHIEDVAVHSDYQGHGIGSALIEHVLQVCRDTQAYKVILDCEDDVVAFYEKRGFHGWEQSMRLNLFNV